MKTNLVTDLIGSKKIIIYGAGRIGKQVLLALRPCGRTPEFFWDKNAATIGASIDDVSIFEPNFDFIPQNLRNEYSVIITVAAKDVGRRIGNDLASLDYNVIYDRETINTFIYKTCEVAVADGTFVFNLETCRTCPVPTTDGQASCDIFNGYLVNLAGGAESTQTKAEKLIIPRLGLLIGNKCNLCCNGCNHLVDLYKPGEAQFLKTSDLLYDIARVSKEADLINKVVVVGGEAFLHPDLQEILRRLLDLPKIGFVQIITNGAVKPKDPSLFKLLGNERIIVEISGYGSELSARLSQSVQEFQAQLREYNVSHHYLGTLQWFDFGNFSKRPYSEAEHKRVYETCCSVSNDIWDGRLYKCSRSAIGTHLGHLPDFHGDYVDLRQHSGAELRQKLIQFFENKGPEACLHCNGASSTSVIEAGKQVPRFQIHQQ
ncbi:MAG: hypothetical protein A3A96_00985 [Candidatus Zambryskibacteria bacterium RIFCSPLOWO2_01_FULL_39_39]|uniref:Radical SAM core domain-containing protein n=1 Tax=Candidatus Zambryskibacteria bacterium RIFCSPLOWO2_01_FULL_39_39 TaxID=1802758 RepID=A0A1G2TZ40_9BACT|nr:MAG: hypothetical protein A3A96_00985 [Candidatus Zambryskibacteria bacterium RIFCSPLOWO2_01_FULL_39_39]